MPCTWRAPKPNAGPNSAGDLDELRAPFDPLRGTGDPARFPHRATIPPGYREPAGPPASRIDSGEGSTGVPLVGESLDLVVIGLGYVGLPLAQEATRSGLTVTGLDLDAGVVKGLGERRSHVDDLSDADVEAMLAAGFTATT